MPNATASLSLQFERENRYIVIKRKDLKTVPVAYRSHLVEPMLLLLGHLPRRKCLVIESDWPEYELYWQMIERRMTGQPRIDELTRHRTIPVEQPASVATVLPERSPEDYAIEHAQYMAKSADYVLAVFQAYALALRAVDEAGDDGEGELSEAVDAARDDLKESLVNLRSAVYEFRKRSNRCASLPLQSRRYNGKDDSCLR